MQLTKEMVNKFNLFLYDEKVCFRMEYEDNLVLPDMKIIPVTSKFLDSYVLNITEEFREMMYQWFEYNYNIILNCNNTGDIFWSSNYAVKEIGNVTN